MPEAFSVGAAVGAVKTAYDTSKKVYEASKVLANAELKMLIAELAQQLAEANLQMAELKTQYGELLEENRKLKEKNAGEQPKKKWGCYLFEGDTELYCPACWSTKGQKSPTTRLNSQRRQCTVCKATLGSG